MYILNGFVYILRSHMQMCNLFVSKVMFPHELFDAESTSCEWT